VCFVERKQEIAYADCYEINKHPPEVAVGFEHGSPGTGGGSRRPCSSSLTLNLRSRLFQEKKD
jgi:hypothetical protein